MNLNIFIPHLWLVTSSIGLVLAIISLIESVVDFMATRPTNGFRVLAIGDIVTESIRLVMYLAFGFVGIWALRTGAEPDGWWAWILLAGVALTVVKTIIQLLVRRYLRASHPGETATQVEDREAGVVRREAQQ